MTPGTSPHVGSPSSRWTDASVILARAGAGLRPARRSDRKINWNRLARGAAGLHLLAVLLIVSMAWQSQLGGNAAGAGLPALQLLLLIATGAAAALLALRPGEWTVLAAPDDRGAAAATSPQLLAQMSHELRTPLNAVIGFSEVMLHELHGPLGHARYQEYAAYISESGGRLLKASEDTLAVTATMSALMADRRALPARERLGQDAVAGSLGGSRCRRPRPGGPAGSAGLQRPRDRLRPARDRPGPGAALARGRCQRAPGSGRGGQGALSRQLPDHRDRGAAVESVSGPGCRRPMSAGRLVRAEPSGCRRRFARAPRAFAPGNAGCHAQCLEWSIRSLVGVDCVSHHAVPARYLILRSLCRSARVRGGRSQRRARSGAAAIVPHCPASRVRREDSPGPLPLPPAQKVRAALPA